MCEAITTLHAAELYDELCERASGEARSHACDRPGYSTCSRKYCLYAYTALSTVLATLLPLVPGCFHPFSDGRQFLA